MLFCKDINYIQFKFYKKAYIVYHTGTLENTSNLT